MGQDKILVILPARNEAGAIGKVIDEIKALPIRCGIIVADSDSADGTVKIALGKGVIVIACSRGKGKAVREALAQVEADYIFMLDSDYTYPAEYITPMLGKLRGGKLIPRYDGVYGWRHKLEGGAMTGWHKIGNRLLTWLANMLYRPIRTHDLCTGMWGFTGETAEFLSENLTGDGFTLEADIFSSLALAGKHMGYVEIDYRCRLGTKSKLNLWDAKRIAWFLVKRRIIGRWQIKN